MSLWSGIGSIVGGLLGYAGAQEQNEAAQSASDRNAELARLQYPWSEQYAQNIASDATTLYGQGSFSPQVNELQLLGRENALGYGENVLPGLIGEAQESWLTGLAFFECFGK